MVSIKDVAKHANVAISTVSKVINEYPNVSNETKKKVNDAITELGYRPNTFASALSSKSFTRLAIIINPNTLTKAIDEINMQYLSGAINQAQKSGVDIITVFFPMIQNMSLEEVVRYFQSQSVSGLIVFGMNKKSKMIMELVDLGVFKMVIVDAPIYNHNTSSIWINNAQAQYEVALKTVLENNTKKVLYIAGRKDGYITEERLKGMNKLANDYHLVMNVKHGDFSELKAWNITKKHAFKHDVVVCASDLMAIGAMNALIEMDIFRPVCGFDGITLMGYVGKQMNTVMQDFYRIAEEAIQEVIRLLKGQVGENIILEHKIVKLQYKEIIF